MARALRAAPSWADPVLAILRERGLDHERRYADALRAAGLRISDLAEAEQEDAASESLEGLRAGFDVLLQPALRTGRWFGRPDILRRVETPSNFGPWSYEVWDTKLAKETPGGTILQLALYARSSTKRRSRTRWRSPLPTWQERTMMKCLNALK